MSASAGEVACPTLSVRGLLGRSEPILITGGRVVGDYKAAFVGIDVTKLRNAVAIAEAGREEEVRFFGEVDASATNMRRVIVRIAGRFGDASRFESPTSTHGLSPPGAGRSTGETIRGVVFHARCCCDSAGGCVLSRRNRPSTGRPFSAARAASRSRSLGTLGWACRCAPKRPAAASCCRRRLMAWRRSPGSYLLRALTGSCHNAAGRGAHRS
jgi:hypothetical protein